MGIEMIILIVALGLIFDYTNGFHDAATVVSTVIATKVLRPLTALCMAGVFNTLGATQISGVAQTISSGLIETAGATQDLVLAAVSGAILWNLITWYFGLPSSSSYALVGGLVGAALFKGGKGVVLWKSVIGKVVIPMVFSPLIGFFIAFFLMKLLLRYVTQKKQPLFAKLQIVSASVVALSHGLNDAQKSMGIITLGLFTAKLIPTTSIPLWVVLSCALMMGLGTASGGFRIIRTVGYKLTPLEPIHGFAVEASASLVILAASFLGMPLSSTHMIVGSITGVGRAQGEKNVQWATARTVALAWMLTLPAAGLLSYLLLKLFG